LTKSNKGSFHHGDLRKALIETALVELEHCGYENLSLRNLARTLGVSRSAPYRHFQNREALLAELSHVWMERMSKKYTEIRDQGLTAKEGLKAACVAYLRSAQSNPELYRLVFVSAMYWQKKTVEDVTNSPELRVFRQLLYDATTDKSDLSVNEAVMLCGCALHGYAMLKMTGHVDANLQTPILERLIIRIIS